jgi:hypothetical protein
VVVRLCGSNRCPVCTDGRTDGPTELAEADRAADRQVAASAWRSAPVLEVSKNKQLSP